MDITIQRTLYGRASGSDQERCLHGGVSATDVLQRALLDLLNYDPDKLTASWEALSVDDRASSRDRRRARSRPRAGVPRTRPPLTTRMRSRS